MWFLYWLMPKLLFAAVAVISIRGVWTFGSNPSLVDWLQVLALPALALACMAYVLATSRRRAERLGAIAARQEFEDSRGGD